MLRYFYRYVPPCPECESKATGHYVKKPAIDSGVYREETLKNGEIIRFLKHEPAENLYCLECGHEWAGRVLLKLWTKEQIRKEQKNRGTDLMYQKYRSIKEQLTPKKKSIFSLRDEDLNVFVSETEVENAGFEEVKSE